MNFPILSSSDLQDAEATAAEPSGGTVPTWLAVGTVS